MKLTFIIVFLVEYINCYSIVNKLPTFVNRITRKAGVPLELTGQLDPKNSWEVKLILDGVEKIVTIPEDMSVLEMGEKVFRNAPSSCRNGVCTTCSGKVQLLTS